MDWYREITGISGPERRSPGRKPRYCCIARLGKRIKKRRKRYERHETGDTVGAGGNASAVRLQAGAAARGAGERQQAADGKLFAPGTEISITVGSHTSWPYNENWVMWKYFQEATGAAFEIQAIPNESIDTKINLMLASPDTLPDLIHTITKDAIVDPNAMDGAFIALDDHAEEMPNFTKFFDSMDPAQSEELLNQRKSGDGKIYFAPVTGTEKLQNLRAWLYRKDIFEKNDLQVPATMEELYQVSKKLKEIYPESYPLLFRTGLTQIDIIGPAWSNDFWRGVYYDFQEKVWKFGSQEDTMLEIVHFFQKMSAEELIPPDYLTIPTKSWEALVSTDRGFIMPDYLVRMDFFNVPARQENPDFTLALMAPPKGGGPKGQAKIAKMNLDPTGYVICNTGKEDRIANAIKLVDWMYSDEGSELLSWGKEGETYEVVDGERHFIVGEGETAQQKYGVATYGIFQRLDPAAYAETYSKEQRDQNDEAYGYTEANVNPMLWLAFDSEEEAVRKKYLDALKNFNDEQLSKFLLGQRPMSEWDAFQKELEDMHVDEVLAIYDSAYKRAMGES